MPAPKSALRLLSDIISSSVDAIEYRLAREAVEFPSLNHPFDATSKSESLLLEPELITATSHIIAAASQLIKTVRNPTQTVINDALSFHLSSCLRAILETDAVEIIREAGSKGIHSKEIANRTHTDPLRVSRILRLLANHHLFNEVSPDVFSLNRLSSVLDTGKPTSELLERPKDKFLDTSGIAAFVLHSTDEVMKGSAYMAEVFTDPATSHSGDPGASPWNKAFNTDEPIFSWIDRDGNEDRQKRFAVAIAGFQWQSLPKDSLIVDVGGGIGSSSLLIAKAVPGVRIIVQDRETIIKDAEKYWTRELPEALTNKRVKLQVHDFFQPQPIRDATTFLLRFVTHDWADNLAKQILQHLRDAATPETKLIVVDVIVPYTCRASITDQIPGAAVPSVPEPLLPNLGAANNTSYWWDLQMYVFCNGQDRTLGHFVHLAAESGWKVVEVHHIAGSVFGQYVCIPV
ncbi:O-methyltransferase [Crucibulum laeve]|uniref:O-methyltransferase n=1 Tax=Crucibulum laeve TaxID=68775 RepID=A0A5C3MCC6_9AGAR|nr:O-methyltransferase [Crucibulum laeve]